MRPYPPKQWRITNERRMNQLGQQQRRAGRDQPRHFPPPWSIEELDACFVVIDSAGQKLAYVYFEDEPGRRCVEVAPSFQRRGLRVVDLRLMWRSCNSLLKSEFVRL